MGENLSYYVVLIPRGDGYQERVVVADPSLLDVPHTIVGKVEHTDEGQTNRTFLGVSMTSRVNGEAAFIPKVPLVAPMREPYRPPEWIKPGAVLVTPQMPAVALRVVEVDATNNRVVVEKAFPKPNERNDQFGIWEAHLSRAEPTVDRFERDEVL